MMRASEAPRDRAASTYAVAAWRRGHGRSASDRRRRRFDTRLGTAMTYSFTGRKRIRKSFGHIPEVTVMPNLIEVQRTSYESFLQMNLRPEQRAHVGLQEVFKSVFPIRDFAERAALDFVQYELEEPKYDVEECHQRGMTYAAPLRVRKPR